MGTYICPYTWNLGSGDGDPKDSKAIENKIPGGMVGEEQVEDLEHAIKNLKKLEILQENAEFATKIVPVWGNTMARNWNKVKSNILILGQAVTQKMDVQHQFQNSGDGIQVTVQEAKNSGYLH